MTTQKGGYADNADKAGRNFSITKTISIFYSVILKFLSALSALSALLAHGGSYDRRSQP